MDVRKLCMNCMCETLDETGKCSTCGVEEDNIKTSSRHLPMRKILKGKYLIGKVLGEGGFGITYIGFDMDLEIRVAIKEFCPREYAGREVTDGTTIMPYSDDKSADYDEEMDKFIYEAKRLAKFRNQEGIVSVLDYFKENNTAYIVMDYIDGMTLKDYAKSLGRPMPYEQVLTLMHPIIKALQVIHTSGMMHRDISPDNIMITHDSSKVYLIDFGTARSMMDGTLSVYGKRYYTPLEQQSEKGNQGAWTDVYALCATMYQCITGKSIPMAIDRLRNKESIMPINALGISVPEYVEKALFHGLELDEEERTQSMEELEKELYEMLGEDYAYEEKTEDVEEVLTETAEPKKISETELTVTTGAVQAVVCANTQSNACTKHTTDEEDRISEKTTSGKRRWMLIMIIGLGLMALTIAAPSNMSPGDPDLAIVAILLIGGSVLFVGGLINFLSILSKGR